MTSFGIVAQAHTSSTLHKSTIGRAPIRYSATAGTITVPDQGRPGAEMFYVSYVKAGAQRTRPLTFLFNGGPGDSSIYLNLAAFGPKRIDAGAGTAPPPYPFIDNEYSLLDATDLVFVDAPSTGYSTLLPGANPAHYYGIDQDARAFERFISAYITQERRWSSPLYILGESYGTSRAAVLVRQLQQDDVPVAGVILISSTLDLGLTIAGPGNDVLPFALFLPSEAAIHAYHSASRPSVLEATERAYQFAMGPYLAALLTGDMLDQESEARIASALSTMLGIPSERLLQVDLRLPPESFQSELLAHEKLIVGRYDGRVAGAEPDPYGDSYDPSTAMLDPFIDATFNQYLHSELKYEESKRYIAVNYALFGQWNWNRNSVFPFLAPTTSGDLKQSLIADKRLRVFLASGYFDLATPFAATNWTISHLGLSAQERARVELRDYESGHMIYLNTPSLALLSGDLHRFIVGTGGSLSAH